MKWVTPEPKTAGTAFLMQEGIVQTNRHWYGLWLSQLFRLVIHLPVLAAWAVLFLLKVNYCITIAILACESEGTNRINNLEIKNKYKLKSITRAINWKTDAQCNKTRQNTVKWKWGWGKGNKNSKMLLKKKRHLGINNIFCNLYSGRGCYVSFNLKILKTLGQLIFIYLCFCWGFWSAPWEELFKMMKLKFEEWVKVV